MISGLLFLSLFSIAQNGAGSISLLQESRNIVCKPKDGDTGTTTFWIDKKDYVQKLTKDGVSEDFDQVKFLDRGILAVAKTDPKKHIFFQVLMNGQTRLIQGTLYDFKEKDCEDTGASKICKTESLGTLKWTPEKLNLKNKTVKLETNVQDYGIFPNHATYLFGETLFGETLTETSSKAGSKKAANKQGLLLIDYGAPIQILAGSVTELSCVYE